MEPQNLEGISREDFPPARVRFTKVLWQN